MVEISVVIPVYRAEATLARCLEALRLQSFGAFEVIIVDSSPNDDCQRIAADRLPAAVCLRPGDRLLAHEASNLGVARSRGNLVAFLDPDVYPASDWLQHLVAAQRARGGVVVGGIACFGRRWFDIGIHLAKFDKWLAGGRVRPLTDAATANLLIEKALFDRIHGFRPGTIHADTDLSWRVARQGVELWLEPEARVEHHHRQMWDSLLRERYQRGGGFARLWLEWVRPSRPRLVAVLFLSIIPARLASQLVRVWRNAIQAGQGWQALATLPVVAAALYAWLIGESAIYLRALVDGR
jgi:GT2 family glycosyltransferase